MELKPTTCRLCEKQPQTSATPFCFACNAQWVNSPERSWFTQGIPTQELDEQEDLYEHAVQTFVKRMRATP